MIKKNVPGNPCASRIGKAVLYTEGLPSSKVKEISAEVGPFGRVEVDDGVTVAVFVEVEAGVTGVGVAVADDRYVIVRIGCRLAGELLFE